MLWRGAWPLCSAGWAGSTPRCGACCGRRSRGSSLCCSTPSCGAWRCSWTPFRRSSCVMWPVARCWRRWCCAGAGAAYRPQTSVVSLRAGAVHTAWAVSVVHCDSPHHAGGHDRHRFHHADLHHAGRMAGLSRAHALGALGGGADRVWRCADRGGAQAVGLGGPLQPGHAGVGAGVCRLVPDHQGPDAARAAHGHRGVAVHYRGAVQPAAGACCTGSTLRLRSGACSWCAGCWAARGTTA
jgi:hypothetical protein